MNKKSIVSMLVLALGAIIAPGSYATDISELGCGENYAPTRQSSPVYPARAEARGIEGYVVLRFTIAENGGVKDIDVVEQEPRNTFVRAATRAVEDLRFPPCVIDGKATEQVAVSIKYDFKLAG